MVDDDEAIAESTAIYLRSAGYDVIIAHDGAEALKMVKTHDISLIVMDVMMPKMDGIAATMKIREIYNIPIILLTAKSEDGDKVLGLNIGADDYVTKPYSPLELIARVKSAIRRYTQLGAVKASAKASANEVIVIGGLEFDGNAKRVTVDGEDIKLTPLEYRILELFCHNPNHVFTAEEIYQRAWNEDVFVNDNTIAVHIRRIREKIEIDPKKPEYIKVVWGIGYKLEKAKKISSIERKGT
ncbi:MAG: response regulator transcription factor [Clostridiales bacterium]|jgi:DNA-binding response OmpR family regulator|nr:response regulator transcription factor [Clostridiales bacterium]